MRATSIFVLGFGVATLAACGTNRPEIPPELLQNNNGGGNGYPSGPYAHDATVGAVAENFTFNQGWMNPKADNYDPAKLVPISFGDFYDPDGSKKIELLLVNTAAFWCGACKNEHKGTSSNPSLNDHYAALNPRGLEILSLIFQDAQNNPATTDDLVNWASLFEETFPEARDQDYQMGRYSSPTIAPLNMVIDAHTMKILLAVTGDQAAVIWPFIDGELTKRGR